MGRLRSVFERLGLDSVATYINSGNVVFRGEPDPGGLERAVAAEFGFEVPVLLRTRPGVEVVTSTVPDHWVNDGTMKCDVAFLWDEFDAPEVIDRLPSRPGVDETMYLPGAVVWRVDRSVITRSGMARLVGTDLYRGMTIRNINTVRRLATMMAELAE